MFRTHGQHNEINLDNSLKINFMIPNANVGKHGEMSANTNYHNNLEHIFQNHTLQKIKKIRG